MDHFLTDADRHDLATWRVAHPQATFAELEAVVEERVRQVRAAMLDLLLATPVAPPSAATDAAPVRCPVCREAMQARGRRTRHLTVEGDHALPLTRAYAVCPVCGTGLFPPR